MQALPKRLLSLLTATCLILLLFAASPVGARAEASVITKVLTTLSATPVALMDPSVITAATSTPGCHIISAGWFDSGGQAATGAFNAETYRLEINIGADDGYTIDPDAACYLNNSAITSVVAADGKSVLLTRDYTAEIWAPSIYKNPGDETVDEGGWASFVVSGAYVVDYEWAIVDPMQTTTIPVSRIKDQYSNMDYSGDGSTKLILRNIPYELNGWGVICNFVGLGSGNVTRSKPAVLTVIPSPSRVAETPEPTPTPTPEATPSPTPPAETPAPIEHVHQFSEEWHYDARGHWHECPEDRATADEGLHVFRWEEDPAASEDGSTVETGTCEICGYTVTRHTAAPGSSDASSESADSASSSSSGDSSLPPASSVGGDSDADDPSAVRSKPGPLMIALMALIPVDAALIALHAARSSGKRRKHRR